MGPLETIGLIYTLFAVLAFTGGMLVLAWFGFKSLIGTVTVRVTEDKRVHDTVQEDFDREQANRKFQGYTIGN